jgi:hypothetical protein
MRSLAQRARAVRIVASPVDSASLAAFRILFGLVMAVAVVRVLALGWVDEFYIRPAFHFTWDLFPWILPLPGPAMRLLFVTLALLALGVALGWHYRACAALFCVGFTYVELIDKTTYLNHYYLVTLLSGLLVFVPAHHEWSIDAWRRPTLATRTIPSWTVNLLRFQIAIVYVFAGLAKLNVDWLHQAQPLRIWLAARSDLPVIGPLLAQMWVAYAFSWFGAAYDLTIVFFLMWRRTRAVAYLTVVVFHIMTAVLFPIGMFPWLMIVATLMFFPADWPRRVLPLAARRDPAGATTLAVVSPRLVVLVTIYAAIQVAVPLRAYWPGADPEWTNRGFNFAWRVMLVEKAGSAEFFAGRRSTGQHWTIRTRDYVTERQEMMMAQDPFMIRALARHIAADYATRGITGVEVRADAFASLNGRPVHRLIDPSVDLAAPLPPNWILPLPRDP